MRWWPGKISLISACLVHLVGPINDVLVRCVPDSVQQESSLLCIGRYEKAKARLREERRTLKLLIEQAVESRAAAARDFLVSFWEQTTSHTSHIPALYVKLQTIVLLLLVAALPLNSGACPVSMSVFLFLKMCPRGLGCVWEIGL